MNFSGASCVSPMLATGYSLFGDAKWHVMFDQHLDAFMRGPFWVVETDYTRYALIYGCFKVNSWCVLIYGC